MSTGCAFYSTSVYLCPMTEQTTVKIDERGRVTIPQGTRVALGINGEEAWVRLRVETVDQDVDKDSQ